MQRDANAEEISLINEFFKSFFLCVATISFYGKYTVQLVTVTSAQNSGSALITDPNPSIPSRIPILSPCLHKTGGKKKVGTRYASVLRVQPAG